jgi:catechol 2,3-dioxygenase-like lactoylglutathione lyase family enzyme
VPDERMYPILPCPDVDEAIAFYEALGFRRTYRQLRPNPAAVVERDAMAVHLAGIDGFDPQHSYASVIIVVPDPDALYASFADGLRHAMGRVPVAGIPRMVRPRKRWGTVYGFSVVDVGGNWLRISRIGDREPAADEATGGLAGVVEVAARLADAHGDDAQALATLERGIARHADAPAADRRPRAPLPGGARGPGGGRPAGAVLARGGARRRARRRRARGAGTGRHARGGAARGRVTGVASGFDTRHVRR